MVLTLICPVCDETFSNSFRFICGYVVCQNEDCYNKIKNICYDLFERKFPEEEDLKNEESSTDDIKCTHPHCCQKIINDYFYKYNLYFCDENCYKKWILHLYADINIIGL